MRIAEIIANASRLESEKQRTGHALAQAMIMDSSEKQIQELKGKFNNAFKEWKEYINREVKVRKTK